MDRLLWYLFAGSRGGPTRIRIMEHLLDEPTNMHQLAKGLGRDYKTIEYNIRVLRKHVVVVTEDPKAYGALYHPSKNFLANLATFDQIRSKQAKKAEKAERRRAAETPGEPPAPRDEGLGET